MSLIKVVKNLGKQKNLGISFTSNPHPDSVARFISVDTGAVEGFATMEEDSAHGTMSAAPDAYDIEPLIPMNKERFVIIIGGESDSGKSTMGAMFCEQYDKMYPDRQMFLISEKLKDIDRNLSKIDRLFQLSPEEIVGFDINNQDYHRSLFLVDDSDFGKYAKNVFEILNLISTVGREYGISLIFITHYNSRLNATQVFKEWQIYITFGNNLVNNRMLNVHMGLSKAQVQRLIDSKCSFYAFNRIYRVLITDKSVGKY